MNKEQVIEALGEELQSELDQMLRAAREAAAYATDTESKAETKWDTQGLEASYLAAGQAAQAEEIAEAIKALQQIDLRKNYSLVEVGALVRCELGGEPDWFLWTTCGGGASVMVKRTEVTIVTQDSPLAQAMSGRAKGEAFSLLSGVTGKVLQIT